MKAHFQYFKYVLRHKWFVFCACLELGVPIRLAIIHDWTKFTPTEWSPYVNMFFNPDGTKRKGKPDEAFLRAWHHHEANNKHHWGYWLIFSGEKERYAIQQHSDGNPIFIFDFVENNALEGSIPDDFGMTDAYKHIVAIRNRLNRDSKVVALEMPEVYAREMVADWIGAGAAITGNQDPTEWYEKNKDKIILHNKTRSFVEGLMRVRTNG